MITYLFSTLMCLLTQSMIIDFSDKKQYSDWQIVNDGVMGGLSKGYVEPTSKGVKFYGKISLENNGGFTSFRSLYAKFDLFQYKYLTITYRSSGVEHAFQLNRYYEFYKPNYILPLPNTEKWKVIKIDLISLNEYQMGNRTGNKISQNALSNIVRLGFITNEKNSGDFSLEIAKIEFE